MVPGSGVAKAHQVNCTSGIHASILSYRLQLADALHAMDMVLVAEAIQVIKDAWLDRRQVIVFGNGGSALTALHYVTDWSKALPHCSGRPFLGRTLIDNVGLVTAIGNDLAYDDIFSHQMRNVVTAGDVVVAISGSGRSRNVIRAVEVARQLRAKVVAVVGYGGGDLIALADSAFVVDAHDMQIAEDLHLVFGHLVVRALLEVEAQEMRQ